MYSFDFIIRYPVMLKAVRGGGGKVYIVYLDHSFIVSYLLDSPLC